MNIVQPIVKFAYPNKNKKKFLNINNQNKGIRTCSSKN